MNPNTLSGRAARRYDIDWLRVFATYLLLLFHAGMVFNPAPFYHIRNSDVSFAFLILCGFIGLWHMPLFFLLAGWSAFASLSLRGTGEFLKERCFRLFVPLVTGCILLMPAIKYMELSSGLDANYTGLYVAPTLQKSFRQVIPSGLPAAAPFNESFLDFLPTFFTDLSRFTWAHLWFVAYLLTFTILYLPLFRRLLRARQWFTGGMSRWWVYAPILPLAVIQVTMRERWPGLQNLIDDWANFTYYSTFLIAGFLLARFPSMEMAAHGERKRALAIALIATFVLLLGVLGVFSSPAVLLAHTAIAGWCFVLAFLGWARRLLSFTTPTLRYLTESAFPVYLLHQSAIVIPGYFLIQLPLGLWMKFVLLFAVSSALTLAVYHLLVRPFAVPRFLCGMKARAYAPRPRLAPGLTAAGVMLAALVGIGTATSSEVPHQLAASPIGRWYAEGGAAQVDISDCGGALCGRVVWLRSPFDENGCELRDRYNPDQSLRHRPVIGLDVLRGLVPSSGADVVWKGGTIYDPGSGKTYRASLRVVGENRLELRGYVGIPLIGRTTSWFRVGSEQETCREVS
jgi:glucan biosynthesis protein C